MNIEETAQKIEDMTIRGAGRIARSAAEAIADYASNSKAASLGEFLEGMDAAAMRLISTRPTAISLSNAVNISIRGVREQKTLEAAKALAISNAETFVKNSNSAVARIGQNAPQVILKKGMAITICNSSAAISAMVACYKAGKITGVFACETRPKRQGLITVRELAEAGVPVTLIVDSAMRYVMPQVAVAFVGTDSLESDGSVINKIGTHLLAATARDYAVPFYACAETYKFLPASMIGRRVEIELRSYKEIVANAEVPGGVEIFNPVFDRVPPELVTGIITEEGVIAPSESLTFIGKFLGGI